MKSVDQKSGECKRVKWGERAGVGGMAGEGAEFVKVPSLHSPLQRTSLVDEYGHRLWKSFR